MRTLQQRREICPRSSYAKHSSRPAVKYFPGGLLTRCEFRSREFVEPRHTTSRRRYLPPPEPKRELRMLPAQTLRSVASELNSTSPFASWRSRSALDRDRVSARL